ncbi:MAG TPA: VWA domain-containing protein [Jatrophihabitantaceae bacterium]|jgi:Ca-activated chloride channel family protein|nr:VWA domain-containing protein [Jatrophihabitantaceae bacterium]
MHFASPVWLLSLVPVVVLVAGYALFQSRRIRSAASFGDRAMLGSLAPRQPGPRRHLTFALLLASLSVLSIGIARPTATVRVVQDRATVMLAIDVSESMQATDVVPSRIQAAQAAADQFAGLLPDRINLGLVKFGGTASVLVPPTTNRDQVTAAVNGLQLQDSTAIGEAVFASLDAISTFGKTSTAHGDKAPPARIVLMSDGTSNTGRSVADAITAARTAGVTVSTIAFGTPNGEVTIDGQQIAVPADTATLQQVATQTGGSFSSATTEAQLSDVFKNLGSQLGYTEGRRDISWRFLLAGLLLGLTAAGLSLFTSGRLL